MSEQRKLPDVVAKVTMAPTQHEIEQIVRVVLQRVRASLLAPPTQMDSRSTDGKPLDPAVLRLQQKLVTLENVREHWNGIKRLQVPQSTVVTPAVRDELRQRGIVLERVQNNASLQSESRSSKLLLIVPTAKKTGIGTQLEPLGVTMQSNASNTEQAQTIVQQHVSNEGHACIWCTPQPFAAARAAANSTETIAVHLPKLEKLAQAIEEARPNTLILDDGEWTAQSVVNLARAWARSRSSDWTRSSPK